jgi:hypothetical protein
VMAGLLAPMSGWTGSASSSCQSIRTSFAPSSDRRP